MPINFVIPSPFQNRTTCELCAVITDDAGWLAIDPHKRTQLACHPRTSDACISHEAQVLATAIIIHSQRAELA